MHNNLKSSIRRRGIRAGTPATHAAQQYVQQSREVQAGLHTLLYVIVSSLLYQPLASVADDINNYKIEKMT